MWPCLASLPAWLAGVRACCRVTGLQSLAFNPTVEELVLRLDLPISRATQAISELVHLTRLCIYAQSGESPVSEHVLTCQTLAPGFRGRAPRRVGMLNLVLAYTSVCKVCACFEHGRLRCV